MRGRPEKFDPATVADALREHHGMVFHAARFLKCSANTVRRYMRKHPEVQAAVDEARGLLTDEAEMKLYEALQRGESWAVCFYLKTQGRHRGYVERAEQAQLSEVQINRLIERELKRFDASDENLPAS